MQLSEYKEKWRPQFHFTPAKNWMNDPNGMFFYEGEYHLFYQYNPFGDKWGHMSWGHAVSPDMLHWEHLDVALPEADGVMIFSGSAVVDWQNTSGFGKDGKPPLVAIYTGHRPADERQFQCIAYSNDKGRTWTKYAGNPVLDRNGRDFRDPKVIWHKESKQWIMVVALSALHKISFYSSSDLKNWQHLSDFGPAGSFDGLWECPDLFPLLVDENSDQMKWVLEVDVGSGSIAGGSGGQYFIGDFDGKNFTTEISGDSAALWIDYGKDYYAAVSWSDVPATDGRRLWLGWLSNWQYAQDAPTSPWRSAQSIPREVTLRNTAEGIRLYQTPLRELQELRQKHIILRNLTITDTENGLTDQQLRGKTLEVLAEFELADASAFGIKIFSGADQETTIGYDTKQKQLFVDRTRSGNVDFHKDFPGIHKAPLAAENGRIKLHVFVDWSSVEVFGNDGRVVISDLIFPNPDQDAVIFYAKGGSVRLISLDIWELESTWK